MEPQEQQQEDTKKISKKKKIIIFISSTFLLFFILGYVSGAMVSYEEKWFGAGSTFWDALKPF